LDKPREVPGSADRILATLDAYGFDWDGPVLRQSGRAQRYAAAIDELRGQGRLYACDCSRSRTGSESPYRGACRNRTDRVAEPAALRVRVEGGERLVIDQVQGPYRQDLSAASGDFIVRRRDGIAAYALAVVVDDADQGVTEVVRGADLLEHTPSQLYLQSLLGLARPAYAHLPVLLEPDGGKLAKTRRSIALDAQTPGPALCRVLGLLGLDPPNTLHRAAIREIWDWAIAAWSLARVPKCASLRLGAIADWRA
jgi:glutamyl-Q tRNA(Asp) synthetase